MRAHAHPDPAPAPRHSPDRSPVAAQSSRGPLGTRVLSTATTLAGEPVLLDPAPALWWPGGATLFVADLHLGKAATFRARGLPVPGGTTAANLRRLSDAVHAHGARQLVVLGDFLHAAEAQTAAVHAALAEWRLRHARLEVLLVRGNHDSHAGDPPATLGIGIVDEPFLLGPFAACHHPQRHATHHVLAGHLHPAAGLAGPGRERLRLPCFVTEPGLTVLPAFGEFTGTASVGAAAGRQRYGVGGGAVWRLPGG